MEYETVQYASANKSVRSILRNDFLKDDKVLYIYFTISNLT